MDSHLSFLPAPLFLYRRGCLLMRAPFGKRSCEAVSPLSHTPPLRTYEFLRSFAIMTRGMPRPEDVSRDHIDATVIGFLQGERDADWTEVSLVTLHPREEIRLVIKENADRYRRLNEARFLELLGRLRSQGVALRR